MQIKETDFMWSCYKRFYQLEGAEFQSPGNICRYFWISVAGLVLKVFWDFNYFLVLSLWLATMGITAFVGMLTSPTFISGIMTILLAVSALGFMAFVLFRSLFYFMGWLEKVFGEKLFEKIGLTLVYLMMAGFLCLIGYGILFREKDWNALWEGLMGGGIVIGGIAIVCLLYSFVFHPLSTTEFFKLVLKYLKAKKDKVCPLVKMPGKK